MAWSFRFAKSAGNDIGGVRESAGEGMAEVSGHARPGSQHHRGLRTRLGLVSRIPGIQNIPFDSVVRPTIGPTFAALPNFPFQEFEKKGGGKDNTRACDSATTSDCGSTLHDFLVEERVCTRNLYARL